MSKPTYSIQQRHKAKGVMTWYLRTCVDGKQKFESLHTTKKGEAQKVLDAMKAKAMLPGLPGTGDKDIETMVNDWIKQVEIVIGYDTKTYKAYNSRIRKWRRWCSENGIRMMSEFTASEAYRFVQELNDCMAPKTTIEIVKIVHKCLEWNIETFDLLRITPLKTIKLPKLKTGRVEFWTSEELDKIMEKAPIDSYRAFWGLMAYAGLRYSEARNLKASDIKGNIINVINGKGGKDGEIPVSSKLESLIAPYRKNEGLLIPKEDVPIRCDKSINKLKIAVGLAGIPGEVSHHKLRHSFASELLRNGVNPKTVQELMRHAAIETLFKHYAHVLRSDLVDAVEKI